MTGYLVLEDENVFEGQFWGQPTWIGIGEVVFNTSLCGYQEILTDPSYLRQIVVMTAPEQGNYGTHDLEMESKRIWAEGFICVEMNQTPTDGRHTLLQFLAAHQRPALSGIDTRQLTLHLRDRGTPWGCVLQADSKEDALNKGLSLIADRKKKYSKTDWVFEASTPELRVLKGEKRTGKVALMDFGTKDNIVNELRQRFGQVAVFNARATENEILDWNPDAIVLSNGPGDPADVDPRSIAVLRSLLGKRPIFGVCMGHQLLALALGAKTFKLKFGHRGGNHPVKNLKTGEIYMTSQNHGYAVDEKSLPAGVNVSHINLYDKTVEGIECPEKKAWSVQYHPESHPGPHDAAVLFDHFAEEVVKS